MRARGSIRVLGTASVRFCARPGVRVTAIITLTPPCLWSGSVLGLASELRLGSGSVRGRGMGSDRVSVRVVYQGQG